MTVKPDLSQTATPPPQLRFVPPSLLFVSSNSRSHKCCTKICDTTKDMTSGCRCSFTAGGSRSSSRCAPTPVQRAHCVKLRGMSVSMLPHFSCRLFFFSPTFYLWFLYSSINKAKLNPQLSKHFVHVEFTQTSYKIRNTSCKCLWNHWLQVSKRTRKKCARIRCCEW